jgi:CII-binding regulator of phage lambda lysogenization HflD
MARLKRSSAVLETARQRLAGLKSITPKPNFGPALDLDQYEQEVNALSAKLDRYNETLSLLDTLQNELDEDEEKVNDKNKRMLAATGALYGGNSSEYERAGGTRSSEHKRPSRKKTGNT